MTARGSFARGIGDAARARSPRRAHAGAVLSVAPLSLARSDVAASAGVDGTVRVLSLDGGDGGGARLRGHLGPVVGVAADAGFSSVAGLRESIDAAGGNARARTRAGRDTVGFLHHGPPRWYRRGRGRGRGKRRRHRVGGVDGVVRVWRGPSPGVGAGAGDATGARDNRGWRCVGAASARRRARRRRTRTARCQRGETRHRRVGYFRRAVARAGVGVRRRGAAGASEGTGGTGPATGAVHEKKSDAKSDGARPTSPSHGPDSRGNVVGYAGGRGAPRGGWSGVGWTPTTMHRRVGDAARAQSRSTTRGETRHGRERRYHHVRQGAHAGGGW